MVENIPLLNGIAHLRADGGPFVGWIFASGVLLWGLVIERIWYFWRVLPAQAAAMQAAVDGAHRPQFVVRAPDSPAR